MYLEAGQGQGRRLSYRSLCKKCVRIKCRRLCLLRNCADDGKKVAELIKTPVEE